MTFVGKEKAFENFVKRNPEFHRYHFIILASKQREKERLQKRNKHLQDLADQGFNQSEIARLAQISQQRVHQLVKEGKIHTKKKRKRAIKRAIQQQKKESLPPRASEIFD